MSGFQKCSQLHDKVCFITNFIHYITDKTQNEWMVFWPKLFLIKKSTVLGKTTITSGFYRGQRNFKVYITEQTNTNKQTEDKQIIQLNYGKIPKGRFRVFLKSAVQKVHACFFIRSSKFWLSLRLFLNFYCSKQ